MLQRFFMRRVFVLLAAFGFTVATADIPDVIAGDRAFSDDNAVKRAGNWSRADSDAAKAETDGTEASDIPVPRAKPGSEAAKADAARAKTATVKQVPVPRKKVKPKAAVQAGLVASDSGSGDASAPYRGTMAAVEIKELLNGKVVASRIDGKKATITLVEGGDLDWTSTTGAGKGRWWPEKGRICDRYDPSGEFPGRGAGCRSFEQKPDGYYAGGKKLQFVN